MGTLTAEPSGRLNRLGMAKLFRVPIPSTSRHSPGCLIERPGRASLRSDPAAVRELDVKIRWLSALVLVVIAWSYWATALDYPWRLIYESSGQFMSGVARVHLEKGFLFTRAHDWIFNEDNPFEWRGPEPLEPRPYGHHPPALGLALAAIFAIFGQGRSIARGATVISHIASLLILVSASRRWAPRMPAAPFFVGLVFILVPMSGFFGRHVSQEEWLTPWILIATAAYVRRIERGGDGTKREDALVCAAIAIACFYDWPGFYLPPVLVLFEIVRGHAFGRLNRWLVLTTVVMAAFILAHLAWALPGGLKLLTSGAEKRVDPAVLGINLHDWVWRIWDFTRSGYTLPVLVAAAVAVVGWLGRLVVVGRRHEAAATFVALWLIFAAIHIIAFPGGSWVHIYWMFYLMPAFALCAGFTAAAAWHCPERWLRWPARFAVAVWFLSIICAAHETLYLWFASGAYPTGNPLIEWKPDSILQGLCRCCGPVSFSWRVALGFAVGGAFLLRLLRAEDLSEAAGNALLVAGLAIVFLSLTPGSTSYDAGLRFARALVGGHASLAERIPWLEMFEHDGRFWFSYPPMTAFLVVPWIVVTAGYGGQPLFNTILIIGSALLLYRLLRSFEGVKHLAALATVGYALGTPLVYSAAVGNVWLLMHSEGNFLLLLSLWLGFVVGAWGWAGFFLMAAAQCRYVLALAGIAFAIRFFVDAYGTGRWDEFFRRSVRFAVGMLPPLLATLLFQWLAFGSPFTAAYHLAWNEWGPKGPDFGFEYFFRNLNLYFLTTPQLVTGFPFLRFDASGQSIWSMSPFFFGVFIARWRVPFVRCFAPAAVAMFVFYCLYWWTGYAQYGTRYMQDLYPLLVPLAAAGFSRPAETWSYVFGWLIALSVAINLYGAYVVLNVQG